MTSKRRALADPEGPLSAETIENIRHNAWRSVEHNGTYCIGSHTILSLLALVDRQQVTIEVLRLQAYQRNQ